MKKLYFFFAMLLLVASSSNAQLTGITPNQGVHGQTLPTTITSSGIFIQSSSPSGNLYQIRLIQGANVISVFEYWGFGWNTTVIDPNTVSTEVVVPITAVAGAYDLEVITGDVFDPQWNQTTYTLPAAFTVLPPDGYVTGNVFSDLNKNGIKDGGEPNVSNRYISLLPLNYFVYTDVNGNYSFPVANGNYSVVLPINSSSYTFVTTSNDTLAVTVNNNTASGNDFGLKEALYSITPTIGYKGITTTHQLVADEPIFVPSGGNGNVTQIRVYSSPSFYVLPISSVTVIDAFTIQAVITVPVNTAIGTNLDIRVSVSGQYNGSHFLSDQFNVQAPPSYVSGTHFFDQNQNKLFDTGEPGISGLKTTLTPDNSIAFSDIYGNYLMGSLGGQQVLTPSNIPSDLSLFTDSTTYTFTAVGNITGKNFGYISTNVDYSIDVKSNSIFPRCNTSQYVYFKIRNTSNVTYNATAWLNYDPLMNYVSSPITPTSVVNDTIYWNIPNILPYSEVLIQALLTIPGVGSTITFTSGATSLNGSGVPQLSDNLTTTTGVFCAYDPNDKQVTPPGIFAQNYTLMSDTLEYLIRFQNTGNDTAFNVVVLDTLDSDLDYNTFEILDNSHSMQTELESNGAIKFNFVNILLVDSNANEPESHGYIKYRIRAKTGLPDTTLITNTGYIYFDFNPAIVTNVTLNTLVYILPVGLNEPGTSDNTVVIYPNPFSETATLHFENPRSEATSLEIFDITGKSVGNIQRTTGNTFTLEKNKIANGIYFYNLVNTVANTSRKGKFIIE